MAKARSNGPAQREALRGQEALKELWRQTGKPMCKLTLSMQPVTLFDSHVLLDNLTYKIHFGPVKQEGFTVSDFSHVGYYWMDDSDEEFYKLLYGPNWEPTERHGLSP